MLPEESERRSPSAAGLWAAGQKRAPASGAGAEAGGCPDLREDPQRPYRDRQEPQVGGLCSAGTPPCLKAPQAHPHPDSPDGPVTRTFSKRLQKDREEEKMHKAAPSLPGPTRKSRLPGSTSRDHSKSPSNAQAPSLQGAHKILSKMSKSHLPDKA